MTQIYVDLAANEPVNLVDSEATAIHGIWRRGIYVPALSSWHQKRKDGGGQRSKDHPVSILQTFSVKFVTASRLASPSCVAIHSLEPIKSPNQTSVIFAYRRIGWTKEWN